MRSIIVCFKITCDYDELPLSAWSETDSLSRPKTIMARRMIGCFDEAALENGLLLRTLIENTGEEIRLIALTVNPGYSEHISRRIVAVGYDKVISIQTKENLDFCPEETAQVIANAIGQISDEALILVGAQCTPGNTGIVPFLLAEKQKAEIYGDVTRFLLWNGHVVAEQETEAGYFAVPVKAGSIYILNNTERSFLRIPTLREKMKFKNYLPEEILSKIVRSGEDPLFHAAVSERQCKFLSGEDLELLKEEIRDGVSE